MDLNSFNVDDEKSVGGVWVPLGKDAELLIARLNNEKMREYIKKKMAPYRSAMRAGTVDDDLLTEISIQAMARFVLLDWKGLTDGDEKLVYSLPKCEEILRNKEAFRDLVTSLSQDQQLFREAELEDGAKN